MYLVVNIKQMRRAFVKLTSGRYFIRDQLPGRTILHHSDVSLGLGYWHVAGASLCPFTSTSASFGGLFLHTVFCGGLSEKSLKASLRSTEHPDTQCLVQVQPPAAGPLAVSIPVSGPLPLAVPTFLVLGIKQDKAWSRDIRHGVDTQFGSGKWK